MRNLIRNLAFLLTFTLICMAPVKAFDDERPSAVFTVNDSSDTVDVMPGDGICADNFGSCTLRAAVTEANLTTASDTITFAPDLASVINLTRGQLSITNPITIAGPGARNLTIQRTMSPNASSFRLFDITAPLEMSGVTLKNGKGTTGGAIRTTAVIILSEMAITGNQAKAGAAIYFSDTSIVSFSVVERCLINGNVASGQGGAIYTSTDTLVTIHSSTMTGNSAQQAGAIANNGWTILVNNTIVRNSARYLSQVVNTPGSKLELLNNIVGLDSGRSNSSISGSIYSHGGNIITNPAESRGWSATDILKDLDLRLGTLANNGGPTDSMAPLPDSPAIDNGVHCFTCLGLWEYRVFYDQRGYNRTVGRVDIGAVELNSVPPAIQLKTASIRPPSR
jgi:predicted outer membrane repeat protein